MPSVTIAGRSTSPPPRNEEASHVDTVTERPHHPIDDREANPSNAKLAAATFNEQGDALCPNGHTGPFRYVEAVWVWRDVIKASRDSMIAGGRYETGDGYDDGIENTQRLECHHYDDEERGQGWCGAEFKLPRSVDDWQ